MSNSHQGVRMRFGGSPIISVILCVVTLILLYFYWSVGGQLKTTRAKVVVLKETVRMLEDEKERLANRLSVLSEDIKKENRAKREMETKARSMKVQLDEAQMKLQSAENKVTEFQSSMESLQEQLDVKTDENEQLTQQIMEKDSKIDDFAKQKEEMATELNGHNQELEKDKNSLNMQIGNLQKQIAFLNGEIQNGLAKSQSLQQELYKCRNSPPNVQPRQQHNYQEQANYQPLPPARPQEFSNNIHQLTNNDQQRFPKYQPQTQPQTRPQTQPQTQPQPQKWPTFTQPPDDNWESHIQENGVNHVTIDDHGDHFDEMHRNTAQDSHHEGEKVPDEGEDDENNAHNGEILLEDEKKVEEDMKDAIEYDEEKRDEADQPANPEDDNEGGPPPNDDYGNNPMNGDNGDVDENGDDDEKDDNRDSENDGGNENDLENDNEDGKDDGNHVNNLENDSEGDKNENEDEGGNEDEQDEDDNGPDGALETRNDNKETNNDDDNDGNEIRVNGQVENYKVEPQNAMEQPQYDKPENKQPHDFEANDDAQYDTAQLSRSQRSVFPNPPNYRNAEVNTMNRFNKFSNWPGGDLNGNDPQRNMITHEQMREHMGQFGPQMNNRRRQQQDEFSQNRFGQQPGNFNPFQKRREQL